MLGTEWNTCHLASCTWNPLMQTSNNSIVVGLSNNQTCYKLLQLYATLLPWHHCHDQGGIITVYQTVLYFFVIQYLLSFYPENVLQSLHIHLPQRIWHNFSISSSIHTTLPTWQHYRFIVMLLWVVTNHTFCEGPLLWHHNDMSHYHDMDCEKLAASADLCSVQWPLTSLG